MNPHDIHVDAERLREGDQHLAALHRYDDAIAGYQQGKNYAGIVEALQGKFLTYKHLYLLTRDEIYLLFCETIAQTSLSAAERYHIDQLGSIYFRFGELSVMLGKYDQAEVFYAKAIDNHRGIPAEKGDYRYHRGEAVYRSGRKDEGKRLMLEGLAEIRKYAEGADQFLIHTWESGCCLRLADLLREDSPEEARRYLEEARGIIDSDERLVIRRRQFAELKKNLNL